MRGLWAQARGPAGARCYGPMWPALMPCWSFVLLILPPDVGPMRFFSHLRVIGVRPRTHLYSEKNIMPGASAPSARANNSSLGEEGIRIRAHGPQLSLALGPVLSKLLANSAVLTTAVNTLSPCELHGQHKGLGLLSPKSAPSPVCPGAPGRDTGGGLAQGLWVLGLVLAAYSVGCHQAALVSPPPRPDSKVSPTDPGSAFNRYRGG